MTLSAQPAVPHLSGERFRVRYLIRAAEADARALAETICNEQTVEFPEAALPAGAIRDQVMGRVENFVSREAALHEALISYPVESAGSDLLQLLNVALGLSSLLAGVAVEELYLPPGMLSRFPGPRFGIEGLRALVGVQDRPLLCTALKPMGLTSENLADLAYRCARGGLDILKDDHGISDLLFSPFEERVTLIAAAVGKANAETGRSCLYAANISGPSDVAIKRARFAKEAGADALMILPALTGFELARTLAADDSIGLPILTHPSAAGGFVAGGMKSGFSHYAFYGTIPRLAGVDISVFANAGGRFPVTRDESYAAVAGCRAPLGELRPILPMIGGGMGIPRLPALREEFGHDSIFLIGGGLHTHSHDLDANIRAFLAGVGAS
jgi:ribulose-bisphosphate carboxylase large chain